MTQKQIASLDEDYEVCLCMTNTFGEIIEAIEEGHRTIAALMEAIDVGTACELCHSLQVDRDKERSVHLDEIIAFVEALHHGSNEV